MPPSKHPQRYPWSYFGAGTQCRNNCNERNECNQPLPCAILPAESAQTQSYVMTFHKTSTPHISIGVLHMNPHCVVNVVILPPVTLSVCIGYDVDGSRVSHGSCVPHTRLSCDHCSRMPEIFKPLIVTMPAAAPSYVPPSLPLSTSSSLS